MRCILTCVFDALRLEALQDTKGVQRGTLVIRWHFVSNYCIDLQEDDYTLVEKSMSEYLALSLWSLLSSTSANVESMVESITAVRNLTPLNHGVVLATVQLLCISYLLKLNPGAKRALALANKLSRHFNSGMRVYEQAL